jgi:hypothetical protein
MQRNLEKAFKKQKSTIYGEESPTKALKKDVATKLEFLFTMHAKES